MQNIAILIENIICFPDPKKETKISSLKALAEREGFEPPVPCSTQHFQCCAFDHSATFPYKNERIAYLICQQETTLKWIFRPISC